MKKQTAQTRRKYLQIIYLKTELYPEYTTLKFSIRKQNNPLKMDKIFEHTFHPMANKH